MNRRRLLARLVHAEDLMITVTDIIVLMLAYAGLSLSGICLFWQLSTRPPGERRPADREGLAASLGRPAL